jgi:hypothetical protein
VRLATPSARQGPRHAIGGPWHKDRPDTAGSARHPRRLVSRHPSPPDLLWGTLSSGVRPASNGSAARTGDPAREAMHSYIAVDVGPDGRHSPELQPAQNRDIGSCRHTPAPASKIARPGHSFGCRVPLSAKATRVPSSIFGWLRCNSRPTLFHRQESSTDVDDRRTQRPVTAEIMAR